jgi:hypothetical protein
MAKTVLNIRIEELEMEILKQYCQQSGRTQTDVVRELVRGLKRKIVGQSDK